MSITLLPVFNYVHWVQRALSPPPPSVPSISLSNFLITSFVYRNRRVLILHLRTPDSRTGSLTSSLFGVLYPRWTLGVSPCHRRLRVSLPFLYPRSALQTYLYFCGSDRKSVRDTLPLFVYLLFGTPWHLSRDLTLSSMDQNQGWDDRDVPGFVSEKERKLKEWTLCGKGPWCKKRRYKKLFM